MDKEAQQIAFNRAFSAIRSCKTADQIRVAVRYGTLAAKGLPDACSDQISLLAFQQYKSLGRLRMVDA